MMRTSHLVIFVLLMIATVLLCLPRFNRRDAGGLHVHTPKHRVEAVNPDSTQYVAFVRYFRGESAAAELLEGPFSYRPVGPGLASLLPFAPDTSLNLLNIAAILAAMGCMYLILTDLGCPPPFRLLGCAFLGLSFPTFYYGAINYLDPLLLFVMTVGLLLVLRERWWAFAAVVMVGVLVKETAIILLPIALAHAYVTRTLSLARCVFLAGAGIAAAGAIILARHLAPGDAGFVWSPSMSCLLMNISRPRAWLSAGLTFGAPGLLALFALPAVWRADDLRRRYGVLLAGFVLSLLVTVYSMTSAYLDGRLVWFIQPFAIPLALLVITRRFPGRGQPVCIHRS